MKKLFLQIIILTCFWRTYCFDWEYYNAAHNFAFTEACKAREHFFQEGYTQGFRGTSFQIHNTNFDWRYYISNNNLDSINSEQEAFAHYQQIGANQQLAYCKNFIIAICLHAYDLIMLDTCIQLINFFMRNNPTNIYLIRIAIPIDKNIYEAYFPKQTISADAATEYIKKQCPYHPELVTNNNSQQLYAIDAYIKKNIAAPVEDIDVMFLENRGVDVGSFLLQLDQIIKNEIECDFLVKFHTKKDRDWFDVLTSFLNVKINPLLSQFECIYSCRINCPDYYITGVENILTNLKKIVGIKKFPESFDFAAGTMFIASSKFIKYIEFWDLVRLFKMLQHGKPISIHFEHMFERLFGGIFDQLQLKKCILDYYPSNTPTVFGKLDAEL